MFWQVDIFIPVRSCFPSNSVSNKHLTPTFMLGPRAKTGRLSELLDALKTEVTNLTQEASHYKSQCEELEHKSNSFIFLQ